jgi:hypothetical protein
MTLPGFNAETSLYKSRVSYHSMGVSIQADGVMPQQFPVPITCGPCQYVNRITGECAQTCSMVHCWPSWPWPRCIRQTWYVPCPQYMCWPK